MSKLMLGSRSVPRSVFRPVGGSVAVLLIVAACWSGAAGHLAAVAERVTGVYAKIELTDDQKTQIAKIQKETNEKVKKIEAEEVKLIEKVLTPKQVEAVKKIEEAAAQKKRDDAKKRYQEKKAALEKQAAEKPAAK